jgi:Xaa-Pro aminopeptidase
MDYRRRQQNLIEALGSARLDALVVTHMPNVRYLCGFTGSSGVLVARECGSVLFVDGRYTTQARKEVQGARVIISRNSPLAAAAAWLESTVARSKATLTPMEKPRPVSPKSGETRMGHPRQARSVHRAAIGIEATHMTVASRKFLAGLLTKAERLRETTGLVECFRMVKDPEEIERIRVAVLTGAALLDVAVEAMRPGVTEAAVAAEIEYAARCAGVQAMSFPTIVAAGPRSALPHGVASEAQIPRRGFVVMDFGVILADYCSDMTRTVHMGRPTAEMRGVYQAVREAQQAGIEAVRPGVEAGKVDEAARRVLRRAGLARYFTHSTGHGLGLEIHEPPRLGRGSTDVLTPGMVVTVEPGAYLPGKGGVRIEDVVVVTERGCEVLTPAPKELITL